ncbi:MAG TPA: hypothetical protein PLU30_09140 [Verrucomicrobiae bacterium]|nr:hypothetical protein [Verrucomicrobiae bacterium]
MTREAFRRMACASLAAIAGLGLTVFGAGWHTHPVMVQKEIKEKLSLPPGMGEDRPASFFSVPGTDAIPQEIVRRETVTLPKSEPEMVLEATRGGLELAEDGRLRLTYSGAPPARCPT